VRSVAATPPDRRRVGIAEFAVADDAALVTSGLGSCVGVALYDPETGVGGLVHVMLPTADAGTGGPDAKYADTGIAALVAALCAAGAVEDRLRAKLAGGSEMLDVGDEPVGPRNVAAVREALDERGVPVERTDVGGGSGRSLTFHPDSGRLEIRHAGDRRP
jgi:chemotaxis protein CheD